MKKFEDLFPEFADNIKKVYNSDYTVHPYLGMELRHNLKEALRKDPEEIDDDFIAMIVDAIVGWFEYSVIVDYFETDEKREIFEQTVLNKEENSLLRVYLSKNKLRLNPIRNIHRMFDMVPSLIVNDQLRSQWAQLYRITVPTGDDNKSVYHGYDVEQRMSFMDTMETLLLTICMKYIEFAGKESQAVSL